MLKRDRLLIDRLQHGGYVVLAAPGGMNGDNGDLIQALAAFSDIDDALAFIKDELEPEKPEEPEKPHIATADVTAEVFPGLAGKAIGQTAEKFPPLPERPTYRGVV